MNDYDTDLALATFRSGAADPNLFLVQGWQGHEGVSELYRFEIDLASAQDDIDLAKLLGSRATLTLRNEAGELMPWHGLITELRQTQRDETYAYYRAVLEPQLALLHLFKQSRVYVESNTVGGGDPDLATVIRTTLKQCGLSEEASNSDDHLADYEIRVSAADISSTRSNFICQFEETTFNFLMRRLEQAGIYFWFEQNATKECLVFANQTEQQSLVKKNMFWRPASALNTSAADIAITHFEHTVAVQPKGVVLRDFSVSQPNLNLTVQANVSDEPAATDRFDAFGSIEVYGGHYNKQAMGEQLANLRAEEIACQRNRYTGEAQSLGLHAGLFVKMRHHFRDDFNQLYYVTHVEHKGQQSLPRQTTEQVEQAAFYHAKLNVLPATLQFRTPRQTKQPRVVGFISAIIMAEGEGKYADMNEHGCYKVQFLFAPIAVGQEEKANSAWVRMATPYAGNEYGMNFPLLKGTEVLISFLGGNPDRPIIMAAIPNENNPSLRNEKNASQPALVTAGRNALEFEDREDQQYTRLFSPKENTTFQLGADPKHPEQSGIRMVTNANTGLKSGSYIHDVVGVYKQEIGTKGSVDTDPEPRLLIENLKNQKIADYLEEMAILPEATFAQQLKALQSRVKSNASEIKILDLILKKSQKEKETNSELILFLKEKKKEISKKNIELLSQINNFKENKKDKENKENKENIDKKHKDKYKDVNHMGMETALYKNSIVNTLILGLYNFVTLGMTNNVAGGLKADLTLAGTLATNIGAGIEVNLNKKAAYNLFYTSEFTQFERKKVSKSTSTTSTTEETNTISKKINSVDDFSKTVNKKTTVHNSYEIDVSSSYNLKANREIKLKNGKNEIAINRQNINLDNSGTSVKITKQNISLKNISKNEIVVSPQGIIMKGTVLRLDGKTVIKIG